MQDKYILDPSWQILIKDLGLNAQDVLRHARLPLDLMAQASPALSAAQYFRLWDAIDALLDDPAFPLRLGQAVSVEAFSPPVFACMCSENLNSALQRLSKYKPLVGPMTLQVTVDANSTRVWLGGLDSNAPVPPSLVATELVFLVHLARLATRERIEPIAVHATVPFADPDACAQPFLTANEKMWTFFEPDLRNRMADLDQACGFRARVRACLTEIIAGGHCTVADVADRLAVSQRTLQRRLHDEGTSFQQELNRLREEMARHYLANSGVSSAEIAFLLGYEDPNSFIRAFHDWTGQTPESLRASTVH